LPSPSLTLDVHLLQPPTSPTPFSGQYISVIQLFRRAHPAENSGLLALFPSLLPCPSTQTVASSSSYVSLRYVAALPPWLTLSSLYPQFGMFSLFIKERAFIGEAVIATRSSFPCSLPRASARVSLSPTVAYILLCFHFFAVVGIIAGPYVTGGFDPRSWGGSNNQDTVNEITLVRLLASLPLALFPSTADPPSFFFLSGGHQSCHRHLGFRCRSR
jgi:hypothetical protein